MSDYTPSMFQVKEAYSQGETARWAEFDRWLAEVERAAAEKAWDAAYFAAVQWAGNLIEEPAVNPYRKETP